MPFVKVPGLTGKVYVPEEKKGKGKHRCKDCFSCEFCSDDRCGVCRLTIAPHMPDALKKDKAGRVKKDKK